MEQEPIVWIPGLGFRPAAETVQRDQYGDRPIFIVGDDRPIEAKVPPGVYAVNLQFDPYAHVALPISTVPVVPVTLVPVVAPPPLAPVAIWSSGELLGSVMVIVLLAAACLKFVAVDESCRGTAEGCSGHVGAQG